MDNSKPEKIVENIIVDEFSFLVDEFGFSRVKAKNDRYVAIAKFANKNCLIEIYYEFREAYFNVVICRLVDGKVVPTPSSFSIQKGAILNNHSLNDVLELLSPNNVMQPIYEYGDDSPYHDEKNGLRNYIAKFASNLKKYGTPFFNGDFSLFPALDEIVVARVEEWNKQFPVRKAEKGEARF